MKVPVVHAEEISPGHMRDHRLLGEQALHPEGKLS
jgi:hypothetical protein